MTIDEAWTALELRFGPGFDIWDPRVLADRSIGGPERSLLLAERGRELRWLERSLRDECLDEEIVVMVLRNWTDRGGVREGRIGARKPWTKRRVQSLSGANHPLRRIL